MRLFCTLAIVAALFSSVGVAAQPGSGARPITEVKLIPWRNRWAVEGAIGGKSYSFMLDTAAGVTLLDTRLAKSIGCKLYGRTTGYNMMGTRFDGPRCAARPLSIGGVAFTPPMLAQTDMAAMNPKDADLGGIIGLNLFDGHTVTFDFAVGTLTVESEASRLARIENMRPLPIRLSREVSGLALAALAEIPTAEGPLLMELDSGNGGTILVSKAVAALVGLDPAAEGKQRADFPVLGDIRATSSDAFTPDMIIEGNLGMPFLRNWTITLDLARGLAWIGKPAGLPRLAEPLPATKS